ncbi:uncharacterized protein LOC143289279 [Babylonia areolata]|uniref:uncharacterized protein LOC143289279 n=1 Tax=Babylonia areolata TaxID=304850 RepID=UPI003FD0E0F7
MNAWKRSAGTPVSGCGSQPLLMPAAKRPRVTDGPDLRLQPFWSKTYDLSQQLYISGFYLQGLLRCYTQNLLPVVRKHGLCMSLDVITRTVNDFLLCEWTRGKIPFLIDDVLVYTPPVVPGQQDQGRKGGDQRGRAGEGGGGKEAAPVQPSSSTVLPPDCSAGSSDQHQFSGTAAKDAPAERALCSIHMTLEAGHNAQSTQTDAYESSAGPTTPGPRASGVRDCSIQTPESWIQKGGRSVSSPAQSNGNHQHSAQCEEAPAQILDGQSVHGRTGLDQSNASQQVNAEFVTSPQNGPQQTDPVESAGSNCPVNDFEQRQQQEAREQHAGSDVTQSGNNIPREDVAWSESSSWPGSMAHGNRRSIAPKITTDHGDHDYRRGNVSQQRVQNAQNVLIPLSSMDGSAHHTGNHLPSAPNVAAQFLLNSPRSCRKVIPEVNAQCDPPSGCPRAFASGTSTSRKGPMPGNIPRWPRPCSPAMNWTGVRGVTPRSLTWNNYSEQGTLPRQPSPMSVRNPAQPFFRLPFRFPNHNSNPVQHCGNLITLTGNRVSATTNQTEGAAPFSVKSDERNCALSEGPHHDYGFTGCTSNTSNSVHVGGSFSGASSSDHSLHTVSQSMTAARTIIPSSNWSQISSAICGSFSSGSEQVASIPSFFAPNQSADRGLIPTHEQLNSAQHAGREALSEQMKADSHRTGVTATFDSRAQRNTRVPNTCGITPSCVEVSVPAERLPREPDVFPTATEPTQTGTEPMETGSQPESLQQERLSADSTCSHVPPKYSLDVQTSAGNNAQHSSSKPPQSVDGAKQTCKKMDTVSESGSSWHVFGAAVFGGHTPSLHQIPLPGEETHGPLDETGYHGHIPSLDEIPLPDEKSPFSSSESQTRNGKDNETKMGSTTPGTMEVPCEPIQNCHMSSFAPAAQKQTAIEQTRTDGDTQSKRGQIETLAGQIQMMVGHLEETNGQVNGGAGKGSPQNKDDPITSITQGSPRSSSTLPIEMSSSSPSLSEGSSSQTYITVSPPKRGRSMRFTPYSFKPQKLSIKKPDEATENKDVTTVIDSLITSELPNLFRNPQNLSPDAIKEQCSLLISTCLARLWAHSRRRHRWTETDPVTTRNNWTMTWKPERTNRRLMTDPVQVRESSTVTDVIARRETTTLTDNCWMKDAWTFTRRFKPFISRSCQTLQASVAEAGTGTELGPLPVTADQGTGTGTELGPLPVTADRGTGTGTELGPLPLTADQGTEMDSTTRSQGAITDVPLMPPTGHPLAHRPLTVCQGAAARLPREPVGQCRALVQSVSRCVLMEDSAGKGAEVGETSSGTSGGDESTVRITIKVRVGAGSNVSLVSQAVESDISVCPKL